MLQINALCMAFYARSEEARQTHSVHKLALVSWFFSFQFTCWLYPCLALVCLLYLAIFFLSMEGIYTLILQGTLALEDALSNGLPIRAELDALYKAFEGIDRESLLGLVLSSLPDDIVNHGIDTPLQLSQKASQCH